jgi:phage N-6-adenine-methyltransferase
MTTKNMSSQASFNRGKSKQDYQTPPEFIRAVEKKFGKLVCDLAANEKTTQCQIWYGPDNRPGLDTAMDSLTMQWHKQQGNLWLNPPFDKISPWAMKCASESKLGARILFLVPASVGSNWFADFVHDKAHIFFLNGRLQFVGAKDPYPKDCILAAFGFPKLSPGYSVWRWK